MDQQEQQYEQNRHHHHHPLLPVWWISTHRRVFNYYPDETPSRVLRYNNEMRTFVEQRCCNMLGFIDVFNMTNALMERDPKEGALMSIDISHWGFAINLIKAQIILSRIVF
jgi:hypothetical protein